MALNQSTCCDDYFLLPGQEIPHIFRKPKTVYFLHKSPPLDTPLSQMNPIQSITSYASNLDYYYGHFIYVYESQTASSVHIFRLAMCVPDVLRAPKQSVPIGSMNLVLSGEIC
jgi:hypothetical protein